MSVAALRDGGPGWSLPAAAGGQGQGDRDDRAECHAGAPSSIEKGMCHETVSSGCARLGPLSVPAGEPEAISYAGPGTIRTFVPSGDGSWVLDPDRPCPSRRVAAARTR